MTYDQWADTIICSADYNACALKDEKGNCKALAAKTKQIKRCWHIRPCPEGKSRGM